MTETQPDYDQYDYPRDCPLCGSSTTVNEYKTRTDTRTCDNDDCNWEVGKGGRWSSPRWDRDDLDW